MIDWKIIEMNRLRLENEKLAHQIEVLEFNIEREKEARKLVEDRLILKEKDKKLQLFEREFNTIKKCPHCNNYISVTKSKAKKDKRTFVNKALDIEIEFCSERCKKEHFTI